MQKDIRYKDWDWWVQKELIVILWLKDRNHLLDKSLDNMDMWDNDYFVINKACDIRPGRILLKNVTQKVKVKETSN